MLENFGFTAEIMNFTALINYPVSRSVRMVEPHAYNCSLEEEVYPLDPTSNNTNISLTYNGYCPSGNATGPLVYVNYGRQEDYEFLTSMGVDLTGKIVIARYGRIYRGLKVLGAERRGAAGILIYSDPIDDGYFQGDVYTDGPFRPASGVQEGSTMFLSLCPGDPNTTRTSQLCFDQNNLPFGTINTTMYPLFHLFLPLFPLNPFSKKGPPFLFSQSLTVCFKLLYFDRLAIFFKP